ncbi:acyl carrier protein [Actinomadura rayongensis]|uniref:Acyl carrier protein n=1 Tax=Actinomadura rayongensis TaxID=1429076 RepID=A0A6I4W8J5_9ACTN|nr:phosphopantetheine-binding protein [Actinomadura rayongensis]MXQ66457.1 acyl carrier protein [Actinomadura rayongensis]
MTATTVAEITGLLAGIAGERAAARIGPGTALFGDLALESVEFAALAGQLRERYGADVPGLLAALDIDALIGLTVGELAAYVDGGTR